LIESQVAFKQRRSRIGWLEGIITISTKTLTQKEDLMRMQLLYKTSELYYSHAPAIERSSASLLVGDIINIYFLDAAGYRTTHHYTSHYSGLQRWKFIVTCPEYRSRQSTKDPVAADSPSARPEHAMILFQVATSQHLRE
jgi:hypothetical protein